ncbi:hypothetical protein FHL15_010394 [Xylaria flabelliformis]|uniref:FAD-binding FR-type domain-containing protein n=1 Tax=Xylaria flabelliformis TaxID=2512241 RepID=A0A553HL91_9PEZI|nr:hypothetical protein FHL15_010394 [Xylaria flabelliformis]
MKPDLSTSDGEWALDVFRQSLRTSQLASSFRITEASRLPLDDPEKLEYLRELIQYILDGRTIIASYNLVVLIILLSFTASHFYRGIIQGRKRAAIEGASDGGDVVPEAPEDCEHHAGSSSSSTLEGSLSSRTTHLKDTDADIERQPLLLGLRQDRPSPSRSKPSVFAIIRSWLMYQPRPIPFINRSLPSNATSLFVAGYYGLNIFVHLFKLPFELRYFFAFADRAGYVFVVNLPLLYLLAAKNQPLKLLTGRSYEALNIYHRRVGELMCFEALVHFASMLIWRLILEPEWLATGSLWHYFTHPLILLGIGAFVSYELLYFTSLGSFRERWYELFLASHVLLQIAALLFLWLHFYTSRPYVLASLVIFVLDRIAWRIGLKSTVVTADVEVLEDGETVLLSANWDLTRVEGQKPLWRSLGRNILHGWRPADHVFISIPGLGGSNALQAHPFTIASAAPSRGNTLAQLNLLIRAYSGFTSELLRHARLNSTVSIKIDGPYGSQDPLNVLRASKSAILIAGGSGVAVVFPLLWDLAITHPGKRQIHFMWIIHSGSQRSWLSADRLDKLRQAGVRITIPQPTVEVGRPDVARYISEVAKASLTDISMVVSGPDGLNRTARNACVKEVRRGMDIELRVEKFGW